MCYSLIQITPFIAFILIHKIITSYDNDPIVTCKKKVISSALKY